MRAELLTTSSRPVSMCQEEKRLFLSQGNRSAIKVSSVGCDIIALAPLMIFCVKIFYCYLLNNKVRLFYKGIIDQAKKTGGQRSEK